MSEFSIQVLLVENGHWRWFCSCGSKGSRLIYKEHVQQLAKEHLKHAHPSTQRYKRVPYYSIYTMQCADCGSLVVDHVLHDRWHARG